MNRNESAFPRFGAAVSCRIHLNHSEFILTIYTDQPSIGSLSENKTQTCKCMYLENGKSVNRFYLFLYSAITISQLYKLWDKNNNSNNLNTYIRQCKSGIFLKHAYFYHPATGLSNWKGEIELTQTSPMLSITYFPFPFPETHYSFIFISFLHIYWEKPCHDCYYTLMYAANNYKN